MPESQSSASGTDARVSPVSRMALLKATKDPRAQDMIVSFVALCEATANYLLLEHGRATMERGYRDCPSRYCERSVAIMCGLRKDRKSAVVGKRVSCRVGTG